MNYKFQMVKKGQIIIVNVEKIAFGGEGIVKIDDFAIFVKGVVLGQKVKIVINKKKKNYAKAKLLEVLKKSSNEIEPKCKYFGVCGGCRWQNISYAEQIQLKNQQVAECLDHIGQVSLDFGKIERIKKSPDIWAYRNKVEFSFGYQQMFSEVKEDGTRQYFDLEPGLGFHKPGKWEEIVDIDYCDLITKNANQVFGKIKDWALSKGREVYNPKTHRGFWRQLLLRENQKEEILVNIIVNEEVEKGFFADLIVLLENMYTVKSLYYTCHQGLNDNWLESKVICLWEKDPMFEEILGLRFLISPQSFLQTNLKGTEVLYETIVDYVKSMDDSSSGKKSKMFLDLYCGVGTIGQILAAKVSNTSVVGVEMVEEAVEAAFFNAKENGIDNIDFFCGKVEKVFSEILERYSGFDLVVIDPPRAGLHPKALKFLLEMKVKDMVYVSCNPATLARDLRVLIEGGYELRYLCPVDMFPQTPHIEVVTALCLV